MRILWLAAHYPPDLAASGATLQTHRLAQRIAAAGSDLLVFAGATNKGLLDGETRTDRVDGVDVCWIGTSGWHHQDDDLNWDNPTVTATVDILLDRFQPDVVHAHLLQGFGAGPLRAAQDRGIPTVVTMHDNWWWCARLFLVDQDNRPCPLVEGPGDCACARTASWRAERATALREILGRVDQVLTPSEAMRQLVITHGGMVPSRVAVDENDADVAMGVTPRDRPSRSNDDTTRFVYMGGNPVVKGSGVLLQAARLLRRVPGWQLTMYGVTGRRRPAPRHVTFAPYFDHDQLGGVLTDADVMIIPSIARESYSLVAREALAAGLAVIISASGGPEEIVRHEHNGLVVPTGDSQTLADAMRSLTEDPALLRALRRGATETRIVPRDPDEHATSLLARYTALCTSPPQRPATR